MNVDRPGQQRLTRNYVILVAVYWVIVSVVVWLELRHMDSDWANLPGFLLTLPLSSLVVALYFLASYLNEFQGYNLPAAGHHIEIGYLICAFLNAFIIYPVYLRLKRGKRIKDFVGPPPPDLGPTSS